MPKRFIATELWSEDWFLEMPLEYKLFWYYMLSKCDHAGIFKPNMKTFCLLNEVNLSPSDVINYFNNGKDRIKVISDSVWLIEDFFVFQYGTTFNENNRVHESIGKEWKKNKIEKTSIRGLIDLKDRVKDKDKDIDKDIDKDKPLSNGILPKEEILNEKYTYSDILKVYSGKTYESQSSKIKEAFNKNQFDSYFWFLGLFKEYENKLRNIEFPLLKRYCNDIYSKFSKDEIEVGAKKLQSLGINANADFVCRFIDCIGYATKNNSSSVNSTDLNALNEMGEFKNIKPHLKGDQSFKPKNP